MSTTAPDRTATPPAARAVTWLPAFFGAALIWGTSFMFIKVAVAEVPPTYLALARIALGGVTLGLLMVLRRERLPMDPRLALHLFLFGIVASTVPFALFGYAEDGRASSVLAGIWNGTAPLTTLVVTLVAFRQERPSRRQVVGLLLGFVGVLVVLGVWQGVGGSSLIGQAMLLGATTCYGIAFNYSRWIMKRWQLSALALPTGQLAMSTLQLLVVAPLLAGAPPAPWSLSAGALGSVAALGILGTGLAFAFNFHVVRTVGVTIGSMVTYLPPVVAVIAGVALLHEELRWYQPVGGLVVLAGVGVSQGLLSRLRRGTRSTRAGRPPT